MDFLEVIKEISDDELDEIVDLRINFLEEQSLKYDKDIDTIGYLIDYNPINYFTTNLEPSNIFEYSVICAYRGYIRKNMKIVFGYVYDGNNSSSNEGRYYYVDDDSYVYDFCKYIRNKNVEDEYHLFNYVLSFCKKYFKNIEEIERKNMFKQIYKNENIVYAPINEHKLSWFKGRGNAKCTEYSILAQNILSVFGFDMHMIIGSEKDTREEEQKHAFNLISFEEKDCKKISNGLIDFSMYTEVTDYDNRIIGYMPYYISLDCIDEEFIKKFVQGDIKVSYPDYSFMIMDDDLLQIFYDSDRNYYIGEDKITEADIKSYNKVLKKDKKDV